jgi:hypothetical protein
MKRAASVAIALLIVSVLPSGRAGAAVDSTPPVLNLPAYAAFAVGQQIGTSTDHLVDEGMGVFTFSISELARWSGRDGSGICGYDVEQVFAGQEPQLLVGGTMRTSFATTLGTNYDGEFGGGSSVTEGLQVTAHDCAGNSTSKFTSTFAHVIQEDGFNPSTGSIVPMTYRGAWSISNYPGFSGGHTRKTTARNASVSVNVNITGNGAHVGLVMEKASNRGKADVYIDGIFKKTIDTYSPSTVHRVIVYDAALSAGAHTIKIVNKATTNRPRIDLDAVLVSV